MVDGGLHLRVEVQAAGLWGHWLSRGGAAWRYGAARRRVGRRTARAACGRVPAASGLVYFVHGSCTR